MNGNTLYGMDSTTDNYDGTTPGKLDGTVTGNVALVHETSTKRVDGYDSLRYVAIKNEDGTEYTFHRFNISVTGYRFELAAPQCALFFIGKFQGDAEAKKHLTELGFTLKGVNDKLLGEDNYVFTAGTVFPPMPAEGEVIDSKVVRSGDAYLFEAYLKRSFDKENRNGYTEEISATARAKFDNGGKQDSEPQTLSFKDAWQKAEDLTDEQKKAILDKLGINQ